MSRVKVYVPEMGVGGEVVKMLAYGSIIRYSIDGIESEEMFDNDEIIFLNEGEDD